MAHYKTTVTGVLTIAFAAIGFAIGKLDWPTASAMIAGGIGLIFAADASKV